MNALAAIHVAKKQLGLDEDTYRAVLVRVTGKNSAAAMNEAERLRVVDALRSRGFQPASRGPAKRGLEGPYAKKLQALWIAAYNLGLVRDRTDAAMLAFVARQTGIEHTRFLRDAADARKAVEALKGWIARDGGVIWGTSNGYDFLTHDPGKIAWAQWRILIPGATLMGNEVQFHREAQRVLGRDIPAGLGSLSPAEWRTVMNAFGERIRKAGK